MTQSHGLTLLKIFQIGYILKLTCFIFPGLQKTQINVCRRCLISIKIKITHLRPGEKLFEELLDNREELIPTYNDKILIAKVRDHDYNIVSKKINKLLDEADIKERCNLVEEMRDIAPEFVPVNGKYIKGTNEFRASIVNESISA